MVELDKMKRSAVEVSAVFVSDALAATKVLQTKSHQRPVVNVSKALVQECEAKERRLSGMTGLLEPSAHSVETVSVLDC